jgi:hypothetical protein
LKKAIILILILALLATPVLASTLQDVEQVVVARLDENHKKVEQSIDGTYTKCRDDMKLYTDSLADEYYDDLRSVLWKDRMITFFLIFFALFMSKAFFRFWDFKNSRKIKELENLGDKKDEVQDVQSEPEKK